MSGDKRSDRGLRRGVEESLTDTRANQPAPEVFGQLRAHHARRSAQQSARVMALRALAEKRKATERKGYHCLGDIHGGFYECDHVSPWTKSGKNVDAAVMIVGQDWSSYEVLANEPPNLDVAKRGFDESFPTNRTLDDLLHEHFDMRRADCYLTNLFALVKAGRASAPIPMKDLVWSAGEFTIEEVRIVAPQLVICLGLRTFRALARAVGQKPPRTLHQAIKSSFEHGPSTIHCVAHTGALGMNNRGRARAANDWERLAKSYFETSSESIKSRL